MGFNLKVWKFGKVWKSLEIPYLEKFGNGMVYIPFPNFHSFSKLIFGY